MTAIGRRKTRSTIEYGDFQTPPALAHAATECLLRLGIRPRSIIEPTCGQGAFIAAAALSFPEAEAIIGIDINRDHLRVAEAAARLSGRHSDLRTGNFYEIDWKGIVTRDRGPWLILGNPPWVTSAGLGVIGSENLPAKSNFHGRAGIEAVTGKSNFDISEWMILRYLDWLEGSAGTIAVLCKTAVARKILLHMWRKKLPLRFARMHRIDALGQFGAAVDACFFVIAIEPGTQASRCDVFDALSADIPEHTIGFLDGFIVSDLSAFCQYRSLLGPEDRYVWRSGIKHDCARVMELVRTPSGYRNGLGEIIGLEDTLLFPMLKSSDLGNGRTNCRAVMLVPQRSIGEDTSYIRTKAPKTWTYLMQHAELMERRGSSIYRNKPSFSVFGVGSYTFSPWKVAISGFYKTLSFVKVGPVNGGRPVVFDDTVYFLPCASEEEASFLEDLLCSPPAQTFLRSMIYWEDKRPITADVLKRLSIRKLAALLGREQEYIRFMMHNGLSLSTVADPPKGDQVPAIAGAEQLRLF